MEVISRMRRDFLKAAMSQKTGSTLLSMLPPTPEWESPFFAGSILYNHLTEIPPHEEIQSSAKPTSV